MAMDPMSWIRSAEWIRRFHTRKRAAGNHGSRPRDLTVSILEREPEADLADALLRLLEVAGEGDRLHEGRERRPGRV